MKILLLGASGAFGTAVETVCKEKNIEYIALTHENIEIIHENEIKSIIEKHKPDVIINSVDMVGINLCELYPQKTFDVNAIAVSNIAKICKEKGIILVQPSTHAVFDGTKDGYYTEEDLPNPINIYAASKYSAECFARNICKKHYIIRLPTLFGKRRNSSPGFVDKMLNRIENNEEIKAPDDKIDTLSYTLDLAKLLIKILEEKKPFGTYHLANSGKVSFYDFIIKLTKLLNVQVNVIKVKDDDFESLGKKPLKTSLKSIKLEPIRSWEDALAEYASSLGKERFQNQSI